MNGVPWGGEDVEPPELVYADVAEFVREWLAVHYARSTDGGSNAWCADWRLHPEAVSRLTALWLAYEHLHGQPGTGLSVFWRDHADPCMARLLSPDGTFARCSRGHGSRQPEPLPCAQPVYRAP